MGGAAVVAAAALGGVGRSANVAAAQLANSRKLYPTGYVGPDARLVEEGAGAPLRPSRAGCTGGYDEYLEGHIPGAVFVSWVRDGVEWRPRHGGALGEGSEQEGGWTLAAITDADVYAPCFEARGMSAEQPVVVYDDGSLTAARVWWQLLLYGHPAPYILQGGWAAWLAAAGKAELYEPCPLKASRRPQLSTVFEAEPQPDYRASLEELLAAAREDATEGQDGGHATVAVVVEVEAEAEAAAQSGLEARSGAAGLRHLRRLRLSVLLAAAGSPPGAPLGGGHSVLAAAASVPPQRLAGALSSALGVAVGPGSGARVLLASGDMGLSACAAGVLLQAAGHRRWAVRRRRRHFDRHAAAVHAAAAAIHRQLVVRLLAVAAVGALRARAVELRNNPAQPDENPGLRLFTHPQPLLSWFRRPHGSVANGVASAFFSGTGRHFLALDGGPGERPLLARMAMDDPGRGQYFFSALRAFHSRTAYGNVRGDHWCALWGAAGVSWQNSTLRATDQLPYIPPDVHCSAASHSPSSQLPPTLPGGPGSRIDVSAAAEAGACPN
ncbi:hypothetical protein TSOC_000904 [Tetrabaena socialis]|uniref:Rhodanese domain-containing protein n=1 Tax=Tetrabaena socialis TaxID=47790 RepID=A0A2J8AI66_9CHLO|nr:hypothetical protein TSOC_000904 [Tetrabaena socialis]|eukprot:PNH12204.1 hypothetical protein TSOC_000904 [Tetrabaena socialis]